MADIKISALPVASSVSDADIVVINQGGTTKTATRGLVNTPTGILPVENGGTGATTQQTALNAIAGAVTANQVLKGNGTNVVLGALTSADIPTLPIAKLSGVAASGANTDLTSVTLTTGTVSTNPSGVTDLVNKAYADSIGSGVNFHDACDYGTLAVLSPAATYNQPGGAGVGVNATLTGQANTALQIDSVTVAVGKRVLVKNQTSAFQNGVYNVTRQGDGSTVPYILTRASDYDTSGSGINEVQAGDFILILSSTLANTAWVQQTPAPINFGVTSISFIQFAAAAAGVNSFNTSLTGLTPSSNTTGAVTLAGTLGLVSGGTGQTNQAAAITALTGTQASGTYLRSDGTNAALAAIQAGDVPTLNQNTSGTAAGLSSTLVSTSGGTGQTAYTDGQLLIGNTATGSLSKATITAGSNVTVTNGNGTITIASTGGAAGVSSFSAGTTGLTPNTATTGAVSLAGTLAVANGGTAATDAGTALFNLGCPAHYVVVRASASQTPALLPFAYMATWTTSSTTVTLTSGDTSALVVGMALSPTALKTFAIASVVNSTTFTISGIPGTAGTAASLPIFNTTNSLFTYPAGAQAALETRTVVVGDVVLFSGQTQTTTMGPWVCSVQGAAGVAQVMTRPSWFSGTSYPNYCAIQRGSSSAGQVYSVYAVTPADSDLAVGQVSLSASLIAARGSVAVLGGNTFTGKNTFQAGSTGSGAVPFAFQAGVLMTTPQAHSVEWDSTQMYVTNSAAERLPVATSKAQINAQTGTAHTPALADAGYLVTLSNAASIAATIPTDASVAFPIGTQILLMQLGVGQVTVSAVTSGTTSVVGKNGLKTSGQYAVISLIKIAANSWVVAGDATV